MVGIPLGGIVHYVSSKNEEYPAIIVAIVNEKLGLTNLHVFFDQPNGLSYRQEVKYSRDKLPRSWHWPKNE